MSLRERILGKYSNCIFCGGNTPATTIDHVPARTIFDLRDRPAGLEFPACEPCNRGARLDEQVAALISRTFPDARTKTEQAEVTRALKAVSNNCPGLLEELSPTFRQQKVARRRGGASVGALNCQGPILNRHMESLAAKIGLALHFERTGRPVPGTGAAAVRWYTNVQALDGELPNEFLNLLGEPRTLRQGRKEVSDQFGYDSIGSDTGSMTAHFATFRFAFAVLAFVAEDEELLRPPPGAPDRALYRPGWLKA